MSNSKKIQVELLNILVKICNDGYEGYATLADNIKNEELQTIFNRLSQQRKLFAEKLNNEILVLGGESTQTGTTEGSIHQNWLKIKSLLSSNNEISLIDSCMTGEEYALEVYSEKVSNANIPSHLRDDIIKQRSFIKGAKDQLKAIKEELSQKKD